MKQLDDRFVLDPDTSAHSKANETKRKLDARFERQEREIVGVKVHRDDCQFNTLAAALAKVKVKVPNA